MSHDAKDATGIFTWLLVLVAFVLICAPALIALSRVQY